MQPNRSIRLAQFFFHFVSNLYFFLDTKRVLLYFTFPSLFTVIHTWAFYSFLSRLCLVLLPFPLPLEMYLVLAPMSEAKYFPQWSVHFFTSAGSYTLTEFWILVSLFLTHSISLSPTHASQNLSFQTSLFPDHFISILHLMTSFLKFD